MRGSHRVYIHPTRPGHVTVSGHPPDDIPEGTWHNIQRQAGWKPQRENPE
ncbi:MAG: type II toxin-antitoxin system HicA family toxin [Thermomicrobiales bacterium]